MAIATAFAREKAKVAICGRDGTALRAVADRIRASGGECLPVVADLTLPGECERFVDEAATAFPNLRFIVEHVGLPRLEDFCWIATQEPNVYGGLAVAMPFIHTRPRYFAQIIGELLYWLDENRITFASDYAIWSPKWIVEELMNFELPEDVAAETGQTLTMAVRRKIMGENAARLYNIDIAERCKKLGLPVRAKAEAAAAVA